MYVETALYAIIKRVGELVTKNFSGADMTPFTKETRRLLRRLLIGFPRKRIRFMAEYSRKALNQTLTSYLKRSKIPFTYRNMSEHVQLVAATLAFFGLVITSAENAPDEYGDNLTALLLCYIGHYASEAGLVTINLEFVEMLQKIEAMHAAIEHEVRASLHRPPLPNPFTIH